MPLHHLSSKPLEGLAARYITHKVVASLLVDNTYRSTSLAKLIRNASTNTLRSASNDSDLSVKLTHTPIN